MQTTEYFEQRLAAANEENALQKSWVENTYYSPEFRIVQSDGRISLYSKITQMNNRYLRVILLKDGLTVKDAFFDKQFSPRRFARGRCG